jgi:hypothetical protein
MTNLRLKTAQDIAYLPGTFRRPNRGQGFGIEQLKEAAKSLSLNNKCFAEGDEGARKHKQAKV